MWAELLCGLVFLCGAALLCGLVFYWLFKLFFCVLFFCVEMWPALLCGLAFHWLFILFFCDDDDVFEFKTSDCDLKFSVGNRIEKLYGGKIYLGLRIPDADTASHQNIDMVLVTKQKAVVINVKNIRDFSRIDADGSWICKGENKLTTQRHPDPVIETKRQVAILETYLEQRGVGLPDAYLSCKVVLPNPDSGSIQSIDFPPEVVFFDQLADEDQLALKRKSMIFGWIEDAFGRVEKETQELHFVLLNAPKWDRLEINENKNLLGEFLGFRGNPEDIQALGSIKRSKVSLFIIKKSSEQGIACSMLQVLYCDRDYRNEGASKSDWKAISVRSSTMILFQPQNSSRVGKFKLSSITSLSLSA